MPDLPISGSKGNVTFVSGFAQSPFSWEARIAGLVRETTPFQPTNGYRTFASANLMGMKGSYKCRQTVNATAAITGPVFFRKRWRKVPFTTSTIRKKSRSKAEARLAH